MATSAGANDTKSLWGENGIAPDPREIAWFRQECLQIDVAAVVAANGDVVNFTRSFLRLPSIWRTAIISRTARPNAGISSANRSAIKGTSQWTFYLVAASTMPKVPLVLSMWVSRSSRFTEFFNRVVENLGLERVNFALPQRFDIARP